MSASRPIWREGGERGRVGGTWCRPGGRSHLVGDGGVAVLAQQQTHDPELTEKRRCDQRVLSELRRPRVA